ncbi:unnamed protein product [Aphanomyces euteiches]
MFSPLSLAMLSFAAAVDAMSAAETTVLTSELEAWKASPAGQTALAHGFLPRTESTNEELKRFANTKRDVERLNHLHPNATFTMSSPFSLLTTDEFKAILGRLHPSSQRAAFRAESELTLSQDPPAATLDWTASGCVGAVQQQGQCGSCWAFATVLAVESSMCLASPSKTLVKLSEQQLTSCDKTEGNSGCQGGYPTNAIKYVASTGICLLKDYPYVSGSSTQDETCKTSCTKQSTGVKQSIAVAPGDAGMLTALQGRPIVVGVAAGNDEWKQYSGGVLNSCSSTELDHAVVAVGYTDTEWKIQNSWGTSWGDKGFMRLQRTTQDSKGTCGVTSDACYPSME